MSTVEQTVPLGKTAAVTRKGKRRPWFAIALFIGPAILFYTIFVLYPLLATIWYSFHTISAGGGHVNTAFVGLKNYIDLLKDSTFFLAVRNTLLWGLVGPVLEMVLATVLCVSCLFSSAAVAVLSGGMVHTDFGFGGHHRDCVSMGV